MSATQHASASLASWNDTATAGAIVDFVERTTREGGSGYVPAAERIAVFDNDGTLWCEKPLPIQADFILRRLHEMAEADPELRERQPWKAAYEGDYAWLGGVMAAHYAGDDSEVKTLIGGILTAYDGMTIEDFDTRSDSFLHDTQHPTLSRPYLECAF